MASPVVWRSALVDVTPTWSGWTDIDLSAYVPSGATGVILRGRWNSGALAEMGFRKNGSTDAIASGHDIDDYWVGDIYVGVDAGRICEGYIEGDDANFSVYLVGYFTSEAAFFTNAVDKSPGAPAIQDIDISSDTGSDTAIAALVRGSRSSGGNALFRKNGSTDTFYGGVDEIVWAAVGCDGSEIFEALDQLSDLQIDLYGYIKDTADATFDTNLTSVTTGDETWVDHAPGGDADGAFYLGAGDGGGTEQKFGVRPKGDTWDLANRASGGEYGFQSAGIGTGGNIQTFGDTNLDVYLVGVTETIAGGTTYNESVSVAAGGAVSAAATAVLAAAASAAGQGAVSSSATQIHETALGLAAQAGASGAAALALDATAALTGSATLTAAGGAVLDAAAAVNAVANVSPAAARLLEAALALTGQAGGAVDVTQILAGSVAVAAQAAAGAEGTVVMDRAVSLGAASAATVSGGKVVLAQAAASATAGTQAASFADIAATVLAGAAGGVSAGHSLVVDANLSVTGSAQVAANHTAHVSGSVNISAAAGVAASLGNIFVESLNLGASATVAASASADLSEPLTLAVEADGGVAANVAIDRALTLAGQAGLDADGGVTIEGSVGVGATAAVAAAQRATLQGSVAFTAEVSAEAAAVLTVDEALELAVAASIALAASSESDADIVHEVAVAGLMQDPAVAGRFETAQQAAGTMKLTVSIRGKT